MTAAGLNPSCLKAQNTPNKVRIIHSDSIVGGTFHGARVQKLLGDVHLRTKKMNMFADSAYKFARKDMVKAYGNIEIDTKKQSIWADTLTYFTNKDSSKLRGRVIIESDSTTLFGKRVDYHFKTQIAHFLDGIRLKDPKGILTADRGFFFRRADSAVFRGDVQLKDSLKYLEGDSLFSNRRRGYYELYGDVFGNDPANNSKLKGDYLQSDSAGKRVIKGHAWLINYKKNTQKADTSASDSSSDLKTSKNELARDSLRLSLPDSVRTDSVHTSRSDSTQSSQEPDTTDIFAHKIISIAHRTQKDTTTTVKAYKNVRVWSTNFSAISDTAKYESKTHTFELWSNAKSWHKNIQLTGPYIQVILQDGDIKKLVSHPNPFVVQQDTSIDRLNQIKGDSLTALFNHGQLSLIRITGNSHLLRFTEKADSADGLIEVQAPLTKIYFKKGKLVRMKSFGEKKKINGHYLPRGKETAKTRLDGFAWNPDKRPKRPTEKMHRRLPVIPEKPPFELPKRYLQHIHQLSPPDSSSTTHREPHEK
jgi:lipopolysaccharide export system protein LptA